MAQITTSEFADAMGTDTRTARKFLRATVPTDEHPGKGARWQIDGTKRNLNKLKKQFDEWAEAAKTKAAVEEEVAHESEDAGEALDTEVVDEDSLDDEDLQGLDD